MQHISETLTLKLTLTKLRKFRGRQPTGPVGDGKTQVVSAKMLNELEWPSLDLRFIRNGPLCFSSIRFIVMLCLFKKTLDPVQS